MNHLSKKTKPPVVDKFFEQLCREIGVVHTLAGKAAMEALNAPKDQREERLTTANRYIGTLNGLDIARRVYLATGGGK